MTHLFNTFCKEFIKKNLKNIKRITINKSSIHNISFVNDKSHNWQKK